MVPYWRCDSSVTAFFTKVIPDADDLVVVAVIAAARNPWAERAALLSRSVEAKKMPIDRHSHSL